MLNHLQLLKRPPFPDKQLLDDRVVGVVRFVTAFELLFVCGGGSIKLYQQLFHFFPLLGRTFSWMGVEYFEQQHGAERRAGQVVGVECALQELNGVVVTATDFQQLAVVGSGSVYVVKIGGGA